jgi:hypothetical protein
MLMEPMTASVESKVPPLQFRARVTLSINGKPVRILSQTVTTDGFNLAGRRFLDTSYTTQATKIYYNIPDQVYATATFTEVSTTHFHMSYSLTAQTPGTWSGGALSDGSTSYATFTCSQAFVSNDILAVTWGIDIAGSSLTSAGAEVLGNRMFNSANSYACPNYISYYNGASEQKRYLGTYANVSNTVHKLSCTADADITCDSIRLYNASSGGTQCMSLGGSRTLPNGYINIIKYTVS